MYFRSTDILLFCEVVTKKVYESSYARRWTRWKF